MSTAKEVIPLSVSDTKLNTPLPSVFNFCPADPSAVGNVNATPPECFTSSTSSLEAIIYFLYIICNTPSPAIVNVQLSLTVICPIINIFFNVPVVTVVSPVIVLGLL